MLDMLYSLHWVDYLIIFIVLFSISISFMRGFLREAVSLIAWVLAIWASLVFSSRLTGYLSGFVHAHSLRVVLAFLIVFIGILMLGGLINHGLSRVVSDRGLSRTTDRFFGVFFGGARGMLLVAVLILLGTLTSAPKDAWWGQSQLIPEFVPLVAWLKALFPEQVHRLSALMVGNVA